MAHITWLQWLIILCGAIWLLGRWLIRKSTASSAGESRAEQRETGALAKAKPLVGFHADQGGFRPEAKPRIGFKVDKARISAKTKPARPTTGYLADTRRLTAACLGDRATADRLIDYEKTRSPGINHAEAVTRAIERLQDDRSRS